MTAIVPEKSSNSLDRMVSVWHRLVSERDRSVIDHRPGVATCWSGSQLMFMNILFQTTCCSSKTSNLIPGLSHSVDFMKNRGEPGLILILRNDCSTEAVANLEMITEQLHLEPAMKLFGMEAKEIIPFDFEEDGFTINRVEGSQAIDAISILNGAAYGIPEEVVREAFAGSRTIREESIVLVGYKDGHPVSVAVTMAQDDFVYLALVATAPPSQGCGYGTATVQSALLAAQGTFRLQKYVLHATEAGRPVYAKLGFQTVASMQLYSLTAD